MKTSKEIKKYLKTNENRSTTFWKLQDAPKPVKEEVVYSNTNLRKKKSFKQLKLLSN